MAAPPTIRLLPPNAPLVDLKTGNIRGEWWRYFNGQYRDVNATVAGSVTTAAGSGLQGGGLVADGISISIAPNGVSNAMIRQGLSTSVIGRAGGTAGNVADIQATADDTWFGRIGGQLTFTPDPTVRNLTVTGTLIVASDPPATAASAGTTGTITWDSGFIYVCTATDTWKRVAIATW